MLCDFACGNRGIFWFFLPPFWSNKGDRRVGEAQLFLRASFSPPGGKGGGRGGRMLGKYWKLGQYVRDWVVQITT